MFIIIWYFTNFQGNINADQTVTLGPTGDPVTPVDQAGWVGGAIVVSPTHRASKSE